MRDREGLTIPTQYWAYCSSSVRAPSPDVMHPKPLNPHCTNYTRQIAPPYLLLTVSRAKLEQKQGYSRPASRRNLQDARCQGDLRLCPHLSPPSGESHTLAESGAVLRRTAVQAGPSFVLVTPMSVSPDPAGLGVGGCHVFLAVSRPGDCPELPQAGAPWDHKRQET